jgi:hypothetical protein
MPIFGSRRAAAPRLAPELDDHKLGKVRKQLEAPSRPGLGDIRLDQVEQVLRDAGSDWDRRTHRFVVLAAVTPQSLARLWLRRSSRDPDALLFRAWIDVVHGRWEGELADAEATIGMCHRAAELAPADPAPWVVLLSVLRLLRRPPREVFPIWREVTNRDPWHREAYLEMLHYLSPEECGSHAQTLDFVDAAKSVMPPQAPAIGLELVAMLGRYRRTLSAGGVDALMSSRIWTQPPAAAALDRALNDWPRPGYLRHAAALADLNLLSYALIQAKRLGDAAKAFQAVGTTVTPWPWELDGEPLEQFAYWQSRVLG